MDILYDDPQVTTRRLLGSWCGINQSSHTERETSSCLPFKLCWAELWWEQVPFKYCASCYTGQLLNWVITYHGTLVPKVSRTTVFKRLVSLCPFFFSRTNNWWTLRLPQLSLRVQFSVSLSHSYLPDFGLSMTHHSRQQGSLYKGHDSDFCAYSEQIYSIVVETSVIFLFKFLLDWQYLDG